MTAEINNYLDSEADTREELVNPKLIENGWKTDEQNKIFVRREFPISVGKLSADGTRGKNLSADYVLIYKNTILAVVEAKKSSKSYTDGVQQAKEYAKYLKVRFAYATNGIEIYQIDMQTAKEEKVANYPSPQQLWDMTFKHEGQLNKNLFDSIMSVYVKRQNFTQRYYQEIAVKNTIEAICKGQKKILLTLATGTGKTRIAFEIIWKLTKAKWNTNTPGTRLPRVLFLADRNILADQAFNAFGDFSQDSLARIKPESIKRNGHLPTAQNIFFTIFQTFMSGPENKPYFGQYPSDFFDFIVVDECHRGAANDESRWRDILNYFSSAVQLGLTATPKRDVNIDTYKYFGIPVYEYSLQQGINDGYLTPFRVRQFSTNYEQYKYQEGDIVEIGEIDVNKTYDVDSKQLQIPEQEKKRVLQFMNEINQEDKTLVFCSGTEHAGRIRDIINQVKESNNVNYCVRVTSEDGESGEQFLKQFQDTEKSIPTILTTSHKLSTGVDAIQVKNIVLLRQVASMIEFKQIIGRGTRLCDNKPYFTIYDFSNASSNFADPQWDGPAEPQIVPTGVIQRPPYPPKPPKPQEPKETIQIKLGNGRFVKIYDLGTLFYNKQTGKPISAKEYIENLIGIIPNFFQSETDLKEIWANPQTRQTVLDKLAGQGYTIDGFEKIKEVLKAKDSDVFDVLQYLAEFSNKMLTRQQRADICRQKMKTTFKERQYAFIDFVLEHYIKGGINELSDRHITELAKLKYGQVVNATKELGPILEIRNLFCSFQKFLYE